MVRQFGYRKDSNLIRIDRVAVAAPALVNSESNPEPL